MKLLFVATLAALVALATETKIKLEELPPAVQAAVREQTKNATLAGLSVEKEKGKTLYEVETKVGGKRRDLLLDQTGAVIETEEQVGMDAVPAAARAAIEKRAAGASITVEKVTGRATYYEAAIRTKSGKRLEYAVNVDGTLHKGD